MDYSDIAAIIGMSFVILNLVLYIILEKKRIQKCEKLPIKDNSYSLLKGEIIEINETDSFFDNYKFVVKYKDEKDRESHLFLGESKVRPKNSEQIRLIYHNNKIEDCVEYCKRKDNLITAYYVFSNISVIGTYLIVGIISTL